MNPGHSCRESERSPAWLSCPSSDRCPKPIAPPCHLHPLCFPVPPRIGVPNRSPAPVICARCAFYAASPVSEPATKIEPLDILQVPATDPTRRFHLFLEGRAKLFSVVVLVVSLCGTPRQIRRFWGGGVRPSQEVELGCGDPVSDLAFFRRVHRPAKSANLLEEEVSINLLMPLVQGRIWARDLVYPSESPSSGDFILTEV